MLKAEGPFLPDTILHVKNSSILQITLVKGKTMSMKFTIGRNRVQDQLEIPHACQVLTRLQELLPRLNLARIFKGKNCIYTITFPRT